MSETTLLTKLNLALQIFFMLLLGYAHYNFREGKIKFHAKYLMIHWNIGSKLHYMHIATRIGQLFR